MHPTTPLPASKPDKLPGGSRSDCLLRRLDEILNHRTAPLSFPSDHSIGPPDASPRTASAPAKRMQLENHPAVDQLRRLVRQAFQPAL